MVHTDKVNADTINAELARMERECVFKGSYTLCEKCGSHKSNHFVKNRLEDGAYILSLVKKIIDDDTTLTKLTEWEHGKIITTKYLITHEKANWRNEIVASWEIEDESLEHAIALAAIQRWKEGGG